MRKDFTLWGVHSVAMFVLFSSRSSGYQLGCAVSVQRPVEHAKEALPNITTEWTPHLVHPWTLQAGCTVALYLVLSTVCRFISLNQTGPNRGQSQNTQPSNRTEAKMVKFMQSPLYNCQFEPITEPKTAHSV